MVSRILDPRTLALAGGLAICYLLAAKVSLLLAVPPGYATAVWPPSGIAVAALLLYGMRLWPGVWLGALAANFAIGAPLPLAAAIATGNTLEAAVAVGLARGFLAPDGRFVKAEAVFRFALVASLASALAATGGVASLYWSGQIVSGQLLENWYTWWQGDLTGIIVVTPFLLAWLGTSGRRPAQQAHSIELLTFGALFALTFAGVFALGWWVGTDIARSLIFLLIPFMAWAGCRFDQRAVTATTVLVTAVTVWAAINHRSPFEFASSHQALLTLQAFISTVALMGLVLCALTRQRRDAISNLQTGSDRLEALVADRTRELAIRNQDLARDIDEKERLAAALQTREAQLAEAQAITHVGSWSWDVKTDRVTWSDELFRIYAIAPEEFGGTFPAYLSRVHPDDRERVTRAVERAVQAREPWELIERICRPDGSVRILKTVGRVLTDTHGSVTGLYGACLDATETIRLEQIQAVQLRITTALLNAPSLEHAIESATRSMCEGLGWVLGQTWQIDPAAETIHQTSSWPAGAAPGFVAESRSLRLQRGEGLPGRCWQQEAVVWVEDVLVDPGFLRGNSARTEGLRGALAFPLIAGNQVLGAMEFFSALPEKSQQELTRMLASVGSQLGEYIVRNRSEALLRQSEERFRLLVQGVKEYAIFMLDPDGRVSTWNTGAERIKGYRADEIIGVHYSRFFPRDEAEAGQPAEELVAATRQGQVEGEGWRVRKDGSRFWANTVVTALRDEAGQLRGFAKVTRDMSDRKRLEALEQAGRHTRHFLATLAHELRNPLAPIRNAVTAMRDPGIGDRELRVCRDIVERQVEHLSRLVDDLFDVSRITSGKVALRLQPIDVATAVTHAVECIRPFVEARDQSLEIDLPAAPIKVQGDLTRLAQVVQNLLHNSTKYTPPRGRIVLTLRCEGGDALIRVRDDGIGIAGHLLPKVFDLFMQAERPVDRSDGGLGVGLTLVRQLVELHGGSVEAFSAGPGLGAEFVIRIPCQSAESSASDVPEGSAAIEAAHNAPGPCRILVVDDNRDAAESMAMLLRLSGHTTWLAFDGHQAVSLAAEHAPDAVVLDIGLPGIDGYEVARTLRDLPQTADSLLIALTGYGQEEDRQRTRTAGFDEHFVKPVDIESLFQAIARHRCAQRAEPRT